MHQRGGKTVTSTDGGSANVLDPQHNLQPDSHRFSEWIDPSSDVTDTEASHLVNDPTKRLRRNFHQKRCCRTSTSSGYSSQSPPLSGDPCYPVCCAGISKDSPVVHQSTNRSGDQKELGLAVIHEAETIPRPIWPPGDLPGGGNSIREAQDVPLENPDDRKPTIAYSCENCCDSYNYRDCLYSETRASREVLFELPATRNSVVDAESNLSVEEIVSNISVARGMSQQKDKPTSIVCEDYGVSHDYTYRLSSSSSSGAGRESLVGVNPVNLRVYGKPIWLHAPNSSRSSSQCPYEVKTLLTSPQKASRTLPAYGDNFSMRKAQQKSPPIAPSVFLVPQISCGFPKAPSIYGVSQITDCNALKAQNGSNLDPGSKMIAGPMGILNPISSETCGAKYPSGEPVYSTQLEGSDESSSYGAIGDSPAKSEWKESSKVFARHLDFTLDGTRAERLGRAIAKAKRKRQLCHVLTAIFGLVFFVLSVVVVSLSVTRGRKVFGSM